MPAPPALDTLGTIRPGDTCDIMQVGDPGIRSLEWTLLGATPGWKDDRISWPVPAFGHIGLMGPYRGVNPEAQ